MANEQRETKKKNEKKRQVQMQVVQCFNIAAEKIDVIWKISDTAASTSKITSFMMNNWR